MPAIAASDVVHLHPDDNVCIATRDLDAGTHVSGPRSDVTLSGNVGLGHKIALVEIPKGQRVVRYGQTIGFATQDDRAGRLGSHAQSDRRRIHRAITNTPPKCRPRPSRSPVAPSRAIAGPTARPPRATTWP